MKQKNGSRTMTIRAAAAASLCVAASMALWMARGARTAHADGDFATQRAEYAATVRKTYDFRFGAEHPFWPSNARIVGNDFIQPGAFPTAEYCAHCHQDAYHQWRQSAHANAFREPFYIKNVNLLIQRKGIQYSRHCEGCHNPIALFSGVLTPDSHAKRPFDKDGVTCMVCHSVAKLQPTYGTGSYVMGIPSVMLDAQGQPIPGQVSFNEILAHPDRHAKAVMKDFYKSPEFCASCHKAALPRMEDDYKWLRAFTVFDEWQNTSFSHRNPLTFYTKDYQSCQDCHMKQVPLVDPDYGAKQGKIASHRWLAGNTAIPTYYHYDQQTKKTEQFLQDDRLNVDVFALRIAGQPGLIAPLGTVAYTLEPGATVEARVVIQNKMIGHSLIPEQRDFYEAWVEFLVQDASGKVLAHSGYLQPNGQIDPRAHSFTNRMIDKDGHYLDQHEVWARRSVAYDVTIQSGRSTLVRYQFHVPPDAHGPLTVTARVNYRHFRQDYLNFVLGKHHPAYPVVRMAERVRTLQIGSNVPEAPNPKDNPTWMRWNNYGITLLDDLQYADATEAFEHVATLRPDYPDAYTNVAVAEIPWEKYASARSNLEKSLQLHPGNPRALYYLALVEEKQGHLDAAISDLQSVVQQAPQSRAALEELGHANYQKHDYAAACKAYQDVQKLDPDDLAAHYNLAILYRRLGDKQKAAEESALFAEEKLDPMAIQPAIAYLHTHPLNAEESVPWHLHTHLAPTEPGSTDMVETQ